MRNSISISEAPLIVLLILGFMFVGAFTFFILLASNYVPFFLGEKIQSTIVGVDSMYHKPKQFYRYTYFAKVEYSKKDIKEKIAISSFSSKKEYIEQAIGEKRIVYYKQGFGIFDSKEMFMTNIFMIVLFLFWFPLGLFFLYYFRETSKDSK